MHFYMKYQTLQISQFSEEKLKENNFSCTEMHLYIYNNV